MVLDDHDRFRSEQIGRAEETQHAVVVGGCGVRRIEKNVVEDCGVLLCLFHCKRFEAAKRIDSKYLDSLFYFERFQVATDERRGRRMIFDKRDIRRSTTDCFNADGSRAGKNIKK